MPEQSINMRVTANSNQGHRKYMEDCYKIRFQRENQDSDESNILFSYFGIFDGHGGKEAAHYAKEKLYWKIIESEDFWSDDENKILKSIHDGFIKCHSDMWKELPKWPKTSSGLPSTSGCTATILFIKKSKAYVGHVGDSGLLLGFGDSYHNQWNGKKLTRDHKPEDPIEIKRIEKSGGEVMSKGGVNRVVWNRPTNTHTGPVRRSTPIEKIPFLAVARSLGDLWSYNYDKDEFIVSPVPDVFSFDIDPSIHKCIVLATDGVWNILKPSEVVEVVRQTDKETENLVLKSQTKTEIQPFVNPSQRLVNLTIQKCTERKLRADNTTSITIMIDKPGASFSENILQNQTLSDSQQIDELCTPNSTTTTTSRFFNTPSFRSKSLISLRRRHWSASTNNSGKTTSVKSLHLNESSSNRLHIKKKLFNNSYSFTNHKTKKYYGNEENMIKLTKTIQNLYDYENVDQEDDTDCENQNKIVNKTPVNSYKRRLRQIKNRLLKTKNALFASKRRMFHLKTYSDKKKTTKSPRHSRTMNRNNQSFVDTVRNKINLLKRNHDNNENNRQSSKKFKLT